MKNEILSFRSCLLLLIFTLIFSCRKSVTTPGQNLNQNQQQNNSTQAVPYPLEPVRGCSYSPDYGDSIIYPQTATDSDYVVSPVNNPGPGTYMSWPDGLAINSSTGAIDVTQSDAGERFDIGFVKSGTTDTCITSLIIGGVSYMDSVMFLEIMRARFILTMMPIPIQLLYAAGAATLPAVVNLM